MAMVSDEAVLIHARPFRESSLMLDFMTAEHGRISGIGRGLKRRAAGLQPWSRHVIRFAGRGDLRQIRGVEPMGGSLPPPAAAMWLMLLGELILRCVPRQHPDGELYQACREICRSSGESAIVHRVAATVPVVAVNYARTDATDLARAMQDLLQRTGKGEGASDLLDVLGEVLARAWPGMRFRSLEMLQATSRRTSARSLEDGG